MKIGIDARFVGPQGTGIGKYVERLIENLQKIDSQNSYSIFLKETNWSFLKLKSKNFQKVLADVDWYSIEEQIKLPKIFKSQNLDILHVPHFNVPILYNGEFVVTIHDLIHLDFDQTSATTRNIFFFKAKRFGFKKVLNSAIKKSSKIITPSNYVKEQIIKTFKADSSKIAVTYEAAEEEYLQESQKSTFVPSSGRGKVKSKKIIEKYNVRKPFLIYVGNAYPHKNLEKLLDAVKILTTNYKLQTTNLILVCPRDVFLKRLQRMIEDFGLGGKVVITGYIPASELPGIFRVASAYVFPSRSEGFGIPGLNAMAAGIPVICSKIATFEEVYGKAALYFDPTDSKDIAQKIAQILTDTEIRSGLIIKGRSQVKKYSWLKMAKETLKVYNSL